MLEPFREELLMPLRIPLLQAQATSLGPRHHRLRLRPAHTGSVGAAGQELKARFRLHRPVPGVHPPQPAQSSNAV
ncbi:hypothetical protein [Streptomyces sp. OE57]|uniref:hypothetical protein n=1 Tax=Streptomyces lacaronensis TaxID=3379885 RepID=UPI0039B74EC8